MATGPVTRTGKTTFLTLPLELRLKIYEYLSTPRPKVHSRAASLTAVFDLSTGPSFIDPVYRMQPTILRVCKQTHSEAVPILYRTVDVDFRGLVPKKMVDFCSALLASGSLGLVRSIRGIFIWWNDELHYYVTLLSMLANHAPNLRRLELSFGAADKMMSDFPFQKDEVYRRWGENRCILRHLLPISQLEVIVLWGYYGVVVAGYLRENMEGVKVVEPNFDVKTTMELEDADIERLGSKEEKILKMIRKRAARTRLWIREWQVGTETLAL